MIVAVITSIEDDGRLVTHSCPATQLIGERGSLCMWPDSAHPILIPWAWTYWLWFKELSNA